MIKVNFDVKKDANANTKDNSELIAKLKARIFKLRTKLIKDEVQLAGLINPYQLSRISPLKHY